jgi:membrane-bound metal-dependent hydrolase YbcI (DUF457 family)
MPPTGFHGLLGLLIAGKMNQEETKVGVAFGSVFPDLDLLGSMSLILIGGILITTLRTTNSFRGRSFTFGLVLGMVIHATLDLFYLDGVALFWPFQAMEDRVILLNYTFDELSKNFEITNWTTKLKQFAFGLIGITIIFLAIAIISIDIPALDRDMFIVLLYIPLAPVYLLTGLLPLIMHNTVEEFSY